VVRVSRVAVLRDGLPASRARIGCVDAVEHFWVTVESPGNSELMPQSSPLFLEDGRGPDFVVVRGD
jgi:hypothetical protein